MEKADEYRAANPNLSDNDIKAFNINKSVWFKSTIAVCVIYGVVAIGLLLLVLFSPSGSQLLTEEFRTFSLTFIGGIIFTIVLLVIQITSFKPRILHPVTYDRDMCPDYWTLEKNTDASLTGDDKFTKSIKCVRGGENKTATKTTTPVPDTASVKLYEYTGTGTSKNTLSCSEVYPNYLAAKNIKDKDVANKPNALACAYAAQCGIPWTSMCPEKA